MNPFSTYRITLNYKGNPDKKKRQLLIFLRINQILLIATIPVAILALTIILPWQDFIPHSNYDINGIAFILYLFSILLIFIGYKWSIVYGWINRHTNYFNKYNFNDVIWEIFNSHLHRIGNYLIIVFFAFVLGLGGANWFIIAPLFIVSGVALVLTFPTDKRIEYWKAEYEEKELE